MTPINPSDQEVSVCQTCGDVGFTTAFVYCVKCLDFVIHRYCLKVIPKTFTELVIWYCESCTSSVQNQVTSPEIKSLHSQKKKTKKAFDPIWRENSSSDSDSACSSTNIVEFDEREARAILQNHQIDDVIVSYPHLVRDHHPPITRKKYRDIASLIEDKKGIIFHHIPKKKRTKNRKRNAAFLVAKKKEHNVSQLPNFECYINDHNYTHAQPIIDPVWRGSFSVVGRDYDDLFEGFVGHLSNKACGKVFEEANELPLVLHLEMLPKTLLWPKSFQDSEPSGDHIALFFFPRHPINERAYDGLVLEMMDDDLAMRAITKNAELLIFTSTVLPTLFRRFRGKYYLWGVFRGKENRPTAHDIRVLSNNEKCTFNYFCYEGVQL